MKPVVAGAAVSYFELFQAVFVGIAERDDIGVKFAGGLHVAKLTELRQDVIGADGFRLFKRFGIFAFLELQLAAGRIDCSIDTPKNEPTKSY